MSEKIETWVVYLMTGKETNGMKAVCEKTEWDAMEKAKNVKSGYTPPTATKQ